MAPVDLLFVLLLLFMASGVYIARTLLILMGLFKDPILRQFERYGDEEPIYYPFPRLLLSLSICAFVLALLLSRGFLINWWVWLPGLLLLAGAVLLHEYAHVAQRYPQVFQAFPRWYYRLCSETNRVERRRLAYMWLHLPWRTRLIYNSSDHAFFLWADLVIVGITL